MDVECEVSQLVYKFRKLDELEILSVEELSCANSGPGAAGPGGSGAVAPLEVVARLMAPPRSGARPSTKRPPTKRAVDPADVIAEIVDEAFVADVIDDDDDVHFQELVLVANAELEPPPPPPPPPPPAPFEDSLEQLVRETELPKWDASTGQIHNPIDNVIIGRARVLDKDTKKERVTVYCRLHQCYPPPLSKKRALPMEKICEWLDEGLALPRGKDGKCAHLALWRKMEADYRRQ